MIAQALWPGEGLGAGVRMVLELTGQEEPGPWSTVIGMVADLIMVDREHAALVDAVRKLGVRVNGDTPDDARTAIKFGHVSFVALLFETNKINQPIASLIKNRKVSIKA